MAGLIIGIVGIVIATIVACYFYYKSKKEMKPQVRMKSFNLISQSVTQIKPDKIRVTYSGENVENMTVTNVAFWNDGKDPVRETDIASTEPIRIVVSGDCRILEADVIQASNYSNRFKCELSGDSEIVMSFEYLEKGDGAVIQVFHTGKSSNDLEIKGEVIGAAINADTVPFTSKILESKFYAIAAIPMVLGCAVGLSFFAREEYRNWIGFSLVLAAIIIYVGLALYDSIIQEKRKSVPDSLNMFKQLQ